MAAVSAPPAALALPSARAELEIQSGGLFWAAGECHFRDTRPQGGRPARAKVEGTWARPGPSPAAESAESTTWEPAASRGRFQEPPSTSSR